MDMTNTHDYLATLLNLSYPYQIKGVQILKEPNQKPQITINIDVDKAYRPANFLWLQGYQMHRWRHLNLFEYVCYLQCNVPSYFDRDTQKSFFLDVPWGRQKSSFTYIFEAYVTNSFQEGEQGQGQGV